MSKTAPNVDTELGKARSINKNTLQIHLINMYLCCEQNIAFYYTKRFITIWQEQQNESLTWILNNAEVSVNFDRYIDNLICNYVIMYMWKWNGKWFYTECRSYFCMW